MHRFRRFLDFGRPSQLISTTLCYRTFVPFSYTKFQLSASSEVLGAVLILAFCFLALSSAVLGVVYCLCGCAFVNYTAETFIHESRVSLTLPPRIAHRSSLFP